MRNKSQLIVKTTTNDLDHHVMIIRRDKDRVARRRYRRISQASERRLREVLNGEQFERGTLKPTPSGMWAVYTAKRTRFMAVNGAWWGGYSKACRTMQEARQWVDFWNAYYTKKCRRERFSPDHVRIHTIYPNYYDLKVIDLSETIEHYDNNGLVGTYDHLLPRYILHECEHSPDQQFAVKIGHACPNWRFGCGFVAGNHSYT
jgi:G:T-mismatch repair DNA endonuclease (very short patch repair protein)